MRSAGDPATSVEATVETSRPRSDRDVQSSNPGPADVGASSNAGGEALWDGHLDDIDMTELADLVRVFFFIHSERERERGSDDRDTLFFSFLPFQISAATEGLDPTDTAMDDFADRFLEIASVSTPLAVTIVIVDDRENRCLILFFSFKRRPRRRVSNIPEPSSSQRVWRRARILG